MIINQTKRTLVTYDEENKVFIKIFMPKLKDRMRYFFKLRKSPGENFYHISKKLNTLGIKTVDIIEYSKYRVVTKEKKGELLSKYFLEKDKYKDLIEEFIELVLTLFKNNIYFGDIHGGNFIVSEMEIYALDLEGYRDVKFLNRTPEEAIMRMEEKVPKFIFDEIKSRWEKIN